MAIIIRGAYAGSGINTSCPNYLSVAVSMASATWNTVATHEVFTVTGLVRLYTWIECTATLTDAADAARIQFGHESDTDAFITITAGATAGAELIATGVLWYDDSPDLLPAAPASSIFDYVNNGLDVGYEVTGAAFTGGSLVFHCVWEALNSTSSVSAGAGGTL